jgi:hypothetical protein
MQEKSTILTAKTLDFAHILNAFHANIPTMVGDQIMGRATKHAAMLTLLQNDLIIVQIDLQFVTLCNIQSATQLNRENDSAQFINLANNTSRFHIASHSFLSSCGKSIDFQHYTKNVQLCQYFSSKIKGISA